MNDYVCIVCQKPAKYTEINGKKPTFCFTHRSPYSINIVGLRCIHESCANAATYGNPFGERQYCFLHKKPEQICLARYKDLAKCIVCNVNIAKYAHHGEHNATHCIEHRLDGQVKCGKRCCALDCVIQTINEFCKDHNCIKDYMKKGSRMCTTFRCNSYASYSYVNSLATKCSSHKVSNMVYNPMRKCTHCSDFGFYVKNRKAISRRCWIHKRSGDILYVSVGLSSKPHLHL